jgi:hypothetical protein
LAHIQGLSASFASFGSPVSSSWTW